MIVTVNGKEMSFPSGTTLRNALKHECYTKGTVVSLLLSNDKISSKSEDFEIVTDIGSMIIHLDKGKDSEVWKKIVSQIRNITLKWTTEKIDAFGAFETKILVNRSSRMYRRYDCFFSLGGNDNNATYFMIAKEDHKKSYGAGAGRIGHITKGRHILDILEEGNRIICVKPVILEESTENAILTKDLSYKLRDGCKVDSRVLIELNSESPESAEHVLTLTRKGKMKLSDATGSYAACSDDQDISIPTEDIQIRNKMDVTVRNDGVGRGRVFFYKKKRQVSQSHNNVGKVIEGHQILMLANSGDEVSVDTKPNRLLSIGMTQAEAEKFLKLRNIAQERTGDTSDDAIVVEQIPEITMNVLKAGKVETFGFPRDKIYGVKLNRKKSPMSVHYFEKVTGLNHKPIGILTVFFSFEGMNMITFNGDNSRANDLYPDDPFNKCRRGDIGLTNRARPQAGLIGIRLDDSSEYGPTGEEKYGTNIFGRFVGDLDKMVSETEDKSVIYIKEEKS
ncbi:MAG: methanogenesis marker 3 protein [archaeon]|nr:methanogenesis marker 3 protein [archaeon]